MLIKVKGTIEFQPEDKTKKHISQASWKRVAMIKTEDDLCEYYAWFIKKRFSLELNKPIRGSHVTIINDSEREMPNFSDALPIFEGKDIEFYIDPEPRTNGEHWWLRVYCPDAESIREICGGKREPYFAFHLTLGYASHHRLAHSMYVLEICKRHEIISSEPRRPMNDHDIFEFVDC